MQLLIPVAGAALLAFALSRSAGAAPRASSAPPPPSAARPPAPAPRARTGGSAAQGHAAAARELQRSLNTWRSLVRTGEMAIRTDAARNRDGGTTYRRGSGAMDMGPVASDFPFRQLAEDGQIGPATDGAFEVARVFSLGGLGNTLPSTLRRLLLNTAHILPFRRVSEQNGRTLAGMASGIDSINAVLRSGSPARQRVAREASRRT